MLVRSLAPVCALASTLAVAPNAEASGFLTARFGSDHGNPMTGNAYAVYFNPAALGGVDGTQLTLDGAIAYRTLDFTRSSLALSPSSSQPAGDPVYRDSNTGNARISNLLVLPFFGAVTDFGTNVISAGVASYVPFGGQAKWNKNDAYAGSTIAPGAVDGPQRWDSIQGSTRSWYNTAAVALTIPGTRFSIGASGSVVLNSVAVTRARNPNGDDDVRSANGALAEGRSYLDASGTTLGVGVGIYYEPLDDRTIRLGLSYQSQPGFGRMRLSGTLRNQQGQLRTEDTAQIDFLQSLPDVIRLGGAWRLDPTVETRLDFEFARWSVMDRQCVVTKGADCNLTSSGAVDTSKSQRNDVLLAIPRNWRNAAGVRGSVSYFASDQTEVFGSLGVDSSAVPDQTMDPTFPDALKVLGAIGVRYAPTKTFLLGVSYNHVYYFPVDTKGKSILARQDIPSRSPSEDGRYDQQVIFLDVNATVLF